MALRVGYGQSLCICTAPRFDTYIREVREHFSSPLLQYAEADGGRTFTLVECPSTWPLYVVTSTGTNMRIRWNWAAHHPPHERRDRCRYVSISSSTNASRDLHMLTVL